MSRTPRLRRVRQARHLGCGHRAERGTLVVSRGRTWLCWRCQPWLPVKTVDQVLADEAARSDADDAGEAMVTAPALRPVTDDRPARSLGQVLADAASAGDDD